MSEQRKPGRPPVHGQKFLVNLDAETVERARALGGGNLSKGIRDVFGTLDNYSERLRRLADELEKGIDYG